MAISYKKPQPNLFKDIWITAGIFSNHYLLERLPQAGPKIWPKDEECVFLTSDKLLHTFLRKEKLHVL